MLKPHASQSIEKMALARQKDLNVLRHMLLHIFVCVCTKYGGGGEVWGGEVINGKIIVKGSPP